MAGKHAAIPHILSRQADPTLCSHDLNNNFLPCIVNHIAVSDDSDPVRPYAIVKSRRAFHTGNAPMESCRPAIIVSFGVTAHCGLKRATVKQESIPWQS